MPPFDRDDPAEDEGDDRVAAALRDALRVGTERTVDRTAREDGYLGNADIRIPLPEQFDSAASQLQRVGLGGQVDTLERTMNRAAEQAASEAASVFAGAIRDMRPADVHAVLNGGSDAATRYLRDQSESELRERYRPIVREQMDAAGVYRVYQPLRDGYNQLPLLPSLELDLDRYVTDQALDGLFTVLAEEEARIRADPAARTTALLRDVFGR
ncbi:DUF4197 domain-containing protein [Aquisalimonas sp.]|uniref:DUF4197 domain-containing protein n=1 Tax=unclassified Aquisalimonas TaxID=2644645 RepID=UPI0025BF65E5|nr:DUF4197 domain-containing protein [Aquisalimonas sp.]